jgi:hypothetical protein
MNPKVSQNDEELVTKYTIYTLSTNQNIIVLNISLKSCTVHATDKL